MSESRSSFLDKVKEAKKDGLSEEEFSQIEELESVIAEIQNKIDECNTEITIIKKRAKKSRIS